MRRMVDNCGRVFIDRGMGFTGLGQPAQPVICPDGYIQNTAPWASEPACIPTFYPANPICPSYTTWNDKRKQCDLPHGSYGVY